jgi:hypothetical protein
MNNQIIAIQKTDFSMPIALSFSTFAGPIEPGDKLTNENFEEMRRVWAAYLLANPRMRQWTHWEAYANLRK